MNDTTPTTLDSALPLATADAPVQENGLNAAKDTQKSDKQIPFTDLLLDVFLVEKATRMRSRVDGADPIGTGHGLIRIQELAQAFEIAQKTCQSYLEKHSGHSLTTLLLESLANAKLDDEDNVLKLVRDHGGCHEAFRAALDSSLEHGDHHHLKRQEQPQPHPQQSVASEDKEQTTETEEIIGNQPASTLENEDHVKTIRLPLEDSVLISKGYQIPVLDSEGITRFEALYGGVPAGYQDQIARIVRNWRKDLWKHVVQPNETDKVDKEMIFKYGSRFFHLKNESQRKKQRKELLRHEGGEGTSSGDLSDVNSASGVRKVIFPEYLTRLLEGLSISGAHTFDTYGLQGRLVLPLVEPSSGAFDKNSVGMTLLYQVKK